MAVSVKLSGCTSTPQRRLRASELDRNLTRAMLPVILRLEELQKPLVRTR
jgi:hypothetical protein